MYKEKQFNKIIKQICEEKNIQYEELSDDWIIKLKKDNNNKFLVKDKSISSVIFSSVYKFKGISKYSNIFL